MGKRISKVNSVAGGFMRFGGLVLVALLFVVFISRAGTAKPNQNIAATPISTVEATIGLATVTPHASSWVTGTVAAEVVLERDYGSWSFRARSRPGMGVRGIVEYDHDTVSSLISYALANRTLGTQLAGQGGEAEVGITFNAFMTPEQFRIWAPTKGLTIHETLLRTFDSNGQEGTLGQLAIPGDADPLPQHRLDAIIQLHQPGGPTVTIRGVYWTQATIDAARLPELALDPQVFLTDVTPNIVRTELITASWPGAEQASIQVDRNTPFWRMEELGLENFRN